MSFGFSVGDFIGVGKLAWRVYKSCKGAGGAFEEISHEVNALHTVLKELEDEVDNPDSIFNRTGAIKKHELGLLAKSCEGTLQSLNKLLIKYQSLGTASKRTWDRIRFGSGSLQDIRDQLMVHKSSLTLYLTTLNAGSLGRIEKKLDELIADVRAGRRADTVLTLADDDDESEIQWNLWKGELAEEGFSKFEIEGYKHWIKATLSRRIQNGELEEQPPITSPKGSSSIYGDHGHGFGSSKSHQQPFRSQGALKEDDKRIDSEDAKGSLDCPDEFYDSDNSCLPTDSVSQVNVILDKRHAATPYSTRIYGEGDSSGQVSKRIDAKERPGRFLSRINREDSIQSSKPPSGQLPAHCPPTGHIFDSGHLDDSQYDHRLRNGDADIHTNANAEQCSPTSTPRTLDPIRQPNLWPSPLLPSRQQGIITPPPLHSDDKIPAFEAMIPPQLSPAVLQRDLNDTSDSMLRSSTASESQTAPFSSNPEFRLSGPPQAFPHHELQRLSINTNGDLESFSTSTARFSHLSSESRTTISSSSSNTLPILVRTGSPAKRAAANHEFIQAATSSKKDDMKNLKSWSKLPHVRSLLDQDTVNTALIELSKSPREDKRRLEAIQSILDECNPYLDCRDPKEQRTPLIWAVLHGHEGLMLRLLAKGASLDARDGKVLRTPLLWAAANGDWKSTEILLASSPAEVFINAKDKNGRTALDLAEAGKYVKTAKTLLRHGAQRGVNSSSPLPLLVELPG